MDKTVLVVDDSVFMRKRIKKKLGELGYEVLGEASNGEEAIALYEELKPDFVTMDITMRGKDGLTASKEILVKYPDAKIVILTMLMEDDYEAISKNLGVMGIVFKDNLDKLDELLT